MCVCLCNRPSFSIASFRVKHRCYQGQNKPRWLNKSSTQTFLFPVFSTYYFVAITMNAFAWRMGSGNESRKASVTRLRIELFEGQYSIRQGIKARGLSTYIQGNVVAAVAFYVNMLIA